MCGGGPKGPSTEEIAAQTRANKELVDAETAKIEAELQAEKDKEASKVMADNKATAEADRSRKQRQQTLLQGILSDEEEDDDTLPDGTAAPSGSKSKKESKTILQSLGE